LQYSLARLMSAGFCVSTSSGSYTEASGSDFPARPKSGTWLRRLSSGATMLWPIGMHCVNEGVKGTRGMTETAMLIATGTNYGAPLEGSTRNASVKRPTGLMATARRVGSVRDEASRARFAASNAMRSAASCSLTNVRAASMRSDQGCGDASMVALAHAKSG